MRWLVVTTLLLAACGPNPTVGPWTLTETVEHRCRSLTDLGMLCDEAAALPQTRSVGPVEVSEDGAGRLRLVDVDGELLYGTAFGNGARFNRRERRVTDSGTCLATTEVLVELLADGAALTGQRRLYTSHGEGCQSASSTDEGHLLSAARREELR